MDGNPGHMNKCKGMLKVWSIIFSSRLYRDIQVIRTVSFRLEGIFFEHARAAAAVSKAHVGGVEVYEDLPAGCQFMAVPGTVEVFRGIMQGIEAEWFVPSLYLNCMGTVTGDEFKIARACTMSVLLGYGICGI